MAEVTKGKYLPTIGLECHVQLKTKTKLFAAVNNDARQAPPNSLISHICVALPGSLPVLNEKAIELSTRAALALGTTPQRFSRFERKHYFYPDLPKGYQITQYEDPIIKGGQVEILVDGQPKSVDIERANLEEDAGKNLHPVGADYTLVDLNRAGTPLLEIVSAPALHSAAEAKALARELWLLMRHSGVSDGDLYHGHMRFDVNVSVSTEGVAKGTRSEVKNLNSFRSVEAAVNYEIKRQIELLEKGQSVRQETLGWDEAKQKTFLQRTKEEAEDYRYMPEPDVPPVELDDAYIDQVKRKVPELPHSLRQKLSRVGIEGRVIEDILDRTDLLPRIIEAADQSQPQVVRRLAFQLLEEPSAVGIPLADHLKIIEMVERGSLSSTAAKTVLRERLRRQADPEEIAKSLNLIQVSDETEIDKIVHQVLTENPKVVQDIRSGQTKAVGFLVGQVMQKSGGQANPVKAQEIIKKQLENL